MSEIVTSSLVFLKLPKRFDESHKGSYGKIGVICGSEEMPGASRLVSRGAYMAGAGLVKSYAGESFAPYLKNDIPEVIVTLVKESVFKTFSEDFYREVQEEIEDNEINVFGCGVSQNMDLENVVRDLILNNKRLLLLDGDGINLLQGKMDLLKKSKGSIILTPHPKEFSRISGYSVEEILDDKEKIVKDFSMTHGIYVLLKGHTTVIASPTGELYLNRTGNSSLSKAGAGDALTGFIAGFAAQGASALDSMIVASYLHGIAGELASKELTEYSVMASDLISYFPKAISSLFIEGDE